MKWKRIQIMNKIFIDRIRKEIHLEEDIIVEDNKIIINKDTIIDIEVNDSEEEYTIEVNHSNVTLNVLGENSKNRVNYLIHNSVLTVQKLVVNNSDIISIHLNSENSEVLYKYSNINYSDNNYHIDVYHNNKNTKSLVINHGVNVGNQLLEFHVNGHVYKDSINCTCNQDNKIINLKDNHSVIKPNLIIDNNMIEANHSAYIGKFKDDEVFYLMSRGLNRKSCYDLLIKAYLIGNFIMEDNNLYLEKIKSIGGE